MEQAIINYIKNMFEMASTPEWTPSHEGVIFYDTTAHKWVIGTDTGWSSVERYGVSTSTVTPINWIDPFEYPTTEILRNNYITSNSGVLNVYADSENKTYGDYSLKCVANISGSLDAEFTKEFSQVKYLGDDDEVKFDIKSSREGNNIEVEFNDLLENEFELVIASGIVDEPLYDFPLTININDQTGINGYDMSAIVDNGWENLQIEATSVASVAVQCPIEVESWDAVNKKATIHTKIPYISNIEDTVIKLTSGVEGTMVGLTGSAEAQAVWDDNFAAVYHMAQDPSVGGACILDSTSNAINGTPTGSISLVTENGNNGIDFNGSNTKISINPDILNNCSSHTIEILFNLRSYASTGQVPLIVDRTTTQADFQVIVLPADNNPYKFYSSDCVSNTDVPLNQNIYISSSLGGGYQSLYFDGLLERKITKSLTIGSSSGTLSIGSDPWLNQFYGVMYAIRISDSARSDTWVKITNDSIRNQLFTVNTNSVTHSINIKEKDVFQKEIVTIPDTFEFISNVIFRITNADLENTFYIDNMYAGDRVEYKEWVDPFEYTSDENIRDNYIKSHYNLIQTNSDSNFKTFGDKSLKLTTYSGSLGQGVIKTFDTPFNSTDNTELKFDIMSNSAGRNLQIELNSELPITELETLLTINYEIDCAKIDEGLTNFPVMVVINNVNFFDAIGDNYLQFRVETVTPGESVTECYAEIEMWEAINNKAVIHVKIPYIFSDKNTLFNIYAINLDNFNYVGVTGSVAAQSVWDSNFVAVYHMAQDPSVGGACILDSTINANYGTPQGAMTANDLVDGDFGKGIEFDGINEINVPSISPTFTTIEAVMKTTSIVPMHLITKDNSAAFERSWQFKISNYKPVILIFTTSDSVFGQALGPNNVNDGNLHYISGKWDGVNIVAFSDDVKGTVVELSGTTIQVQNTSIILGGSDTSGDSFTGSIFEIRLSDIARSDAWIKATNHSLKNELNTIVTFNLLDINPDLWLDANDSETITIDSGVSSWADKSGNANDAVEANAGYQPALLTEMLNAKSIINFNGAGQKLCWEAHKYASYITVSKWTDASGQYRHFVSLLHGHIDGTYLFSPSYDVAGYQGSAYDDGVNVLGSSLARHTEWKILDIRPLESGTYSLNGTGYQDGFLSRTFYGDIAEIIAFMTPPSEEDRQKIEGYLAHKWGLTANLPNDHPYKETPPQGEVVTTVESTLNLTIDSSNVDEDLIDFPVMINLSATSGTSGIDTTAIFDSLGENKLKLKVEAEKEHVISKTMVFAFADCWGGSWMGVRSIEFLDVNGDVISMTSFSAYATSTYIAGSVFNPSYVFNTGLSKIDSHNNNCWLSADGNAINQKLICVFDSETDIYGIIFNNDYDYLNPDYINNGVKNTKIYSTLDSVTNTVYEDTIPNSTLIFDGQIAKHVDENIIDDQRLSLSMLPIQVQCPVEIEYWDVINKKAVLWVKVPLISATTSTVLTLKWDPAMDDNAAFVGLTGSAIAQSVWDSNFVAVYTMAQDPSGGVGCILDSTVNANHGTPYGSMTGYDLVDGSAGKAIEFDGVDDYIDLSNLLDSVNNTTTGTISIKLLIPTDTALMENFFSLCAESGNRTELHLMIDMRESAKKIAFFAMIDGALKWRWTGDANSWTGLIGSWATITLSHNGTTPAIYLNGTEASGAFQSVGGIEDKTVWFNHIIATTTHPATLAALGMVSEAGSELFFSGSLSKVCVSNTARSDAWIKATSLSNKNTFINYGEVVASAITSAITKEINIQENNKFQTESVNISEIDLIENIIFKVINDDSERVFYIDNMYLK